MEGIFEQVDSWIKKGRAVSLATVIKTWGSSPRPAGALMAITDQGEISGSVSGGCVEGAVLEAGLDVIQSGKPISLHFGVADQEAWQVGLSCGGEIDVFVRRINPEDLEIWRAALDRGQVFCRLLVIDGKSEFVGKEWYLFENQEYLTPLSKIELPPDITQAGSDSFSSGETGIRTFPGTGFTKLFLDLRRPPRTVVIVGGVHIAIPLAELADTVGFRVIVIDPRRLFGTQERFPKVNTLLQIWPQDAFQQISLTESTAVVMLTHDPKIDDPAITAALESPAFYVGALGSRKTHQKRLERLTERGLEPHQLKRIHAPVGLNLGGGSPEEIALAVMAEIVQVWHSRK
jgi:xanthine dehydrogenase accessory factor